MSATLGIYFADMSEEQFDEQPGFQNDNAAYAAWIANMHSEDAESARVALARAGAAALLAHRTSGAEPIWVKADELEAAARRLQTLVEKGDPAIQAVIDVYDKEANHQDEPAVEFATDLEDVARHVQWAREEHGASDVTMDVNW